VTPFPRFWTGFDERARSGNGQSFSVNWAIRPGPSSTRWMWSSRRGRCPFRTAPGPPRRSPASAGWIERLPEEVAVRALTAPYTSFRDIGVPTPLDYTPLETALTAHPSLHDPVCARLAPGSGYCVLAADEVEVAFGGLGSEWAAVRRHAVVVLADVRLAADRRARYTAELDRLSADSDERVRDAVIVAERITR
jgi:hypothetical protein